MSSIKSEIRHFHVVVVQKRVMQVQSCCFAYKTYCFLRSRCRPRWILNSLLTLVDVACEQALPTYSKGNEPRENARGSGEATMGHQTTPLLALASPFASSSRVTSCDSPIWRACSQAIVEGIL